MIKNILTYSILLAATIVAMNYIPAAANLTTDIFVGILSSLILLVFIEGRSYFDDRRAYGYLAGRYKRLSFNNINKDTKVDTKYKEVPNYKPSQMLLDYLGQGEYRVTEIQYEEGEVTATLFLDKVNGLKGAGTYQYTKTVQKVDIGTYELFVNGLDKKRLYIFHQNILPSGLSHGYEEWIKI